MNKSGIKPPPSGEWAVYTRVKARVCSAVLSLQSEKGPRRISAMMRVRNEENFLLSAVKSMIDFVDEVVIIDNLSTDATPAIASALRDEYPSKVRVFSYPHEVRRVGHETWTLAADAKGRHSPNLSCNFYNWCLQKCTHPYVMKWDGDMIALPFFHRSLSSWRHSGKPVMVFNGTNVHPDRVHALAARVSDRDALLSRLTVPGMPTWVTSLTRDYPEPRLYPRRFAHYSCRKYYTQRLVCSFYQPTLRDRYTFIAQHPCFLHMKFCKHHPLANYSDDLKDVISTNMSVGPFLDTEEKETIDRWRLTAPQTSAALETSILIT